MNYQTNSQRCTVPQCHIRLIAKRAWAHKDYSPLLNRKKTKSSKSTVGEYSYREVVGIKHFQHISTTIVGGLHFEMANKIMEGKVALITVSSSGMGRAIAVGLAEQGINIICCDLKPEANPAGF